MNLRSAQALGRQAIPRRRKNADDPATATGPVRRRSAFVGTAALAATVLLGVASMAQAVTGFQAQASSNVTGSNFNELDGVADTGFGLAQAQVAQAMGISPARVSRMEHGDIQGMQVESIAAYVTAIGG